MFDCSLCISLGIVAEIIMGLVRKATTLLFASNLLAGVLFASLASPYSSEVLAMLPEGVRSRWTAAPKVWETVIGRPIELELFMAFVASCKILGALAFMGVFGQTLDRLALPCWTIFFCGATYTCYEIDPGRLVGPLIFLVALLVRSVCNDSPSQASIPAGKKKR
mmetsp:Transcript_22654/g.40964  ORF Transcript_22654/g.40964 Transcript_22654/m.40964 type:complete len:165 (+) Transcript_22654:18-512(+)